VDIVLPEPQIVTCLSGLPLKNSPIVKKRPFLMAAAVFTVGGISVNDFRKEKVFYSMTNIVP
jgi:hypothetical protein